MLMELELGVVCIGVFVCAFRLYNPPLPPPILPILYEIRGHLSDIHSALASRPTSTQREAPPHLCVHLPLADPNVINSQPHPPIPTPTLVAKD